jgi:putative glutamine amidotransferase
MKNLKLPIIGILANLLVIEEGTFAGTERIYVSRDYIHCVQKAGGVPIILPLTEDLNTLKRQIESIDALIISGGQDVHPQFYQEDVQEGMGPINLERDRYEIEVIRFALNLEMPILGICRGMQILNVACGGTLYQDLKRYFPGPTLNHSQELPKTEASHLIRISPNTLLYDILNTPTVPANSFHHQAIKELAEGFLPNAISEDRVIEGMEKKEGSFALGVQWHPEAMVDSHPHMLNIFKKLIHKAMKK